MLSKILFTIFAVIAIWKAFSMISRLTKTTQTAPVRQDQATRAGEQKAVEMKPCPRCGAYVDPREGCSCAAPRA